MTHSPSPADVELDPFAIVAISPGNRTVATHSGEMTFSEAAQRLVNQLRAYDWQQFLVDREKLCRDFTVELFVGMSHIGALASLMAEIDLHQARRLWSDNVPHSVGTLRMLALNSET